ncbi:MAG: septum formation protein Maf [Gammaproteobacteria bacterium RIFCSPLOWO2_12_FULL_47_76]|nr:MAG: septum formation protein Maf [Gammaproteobacteria bacterium RIFCSPLOWO2_12_FULL_47_76]
MKIYLASKSPRRQQLLQQIGLQFEIVEVDIDEHWNSNEHPRAYVERVALEKAQAVKSKIKTDQPFAIIGADTSVVLDDMVIGKAGNDEQAVTMLSQLSGRLHYVYSSVAIVSNLEEKIKTSISRVYFKPLSKPEIESYCKTGEPIGKAGGYAIQGHAAAFVERLDGSYSGVMGLPLFETTELLNQLKNG